MRAEAATAEQTLPGAKRAALEANPTAAADQCHALVERFAEGEHTMSQAERPDLYEPAGLDVDEPIDRRRLVEQLAAVVAAAA